MKIQTKKSSKKNLAIIIVAVVVLIIGGLATYAFIAKIGPFAEQTQNNNTSTPSSNDGIPTEEEKNPTNSPDKTPPQYEEPAKNEEQPKNNEQSDLAGIINYKAVSRGSLSIRVTIDERLESGTCTLTLTHATSGKKVTKSAAVVTNPSSSTCEGFDVPVSELGSGKWNITVAVKSNNLTGKIEDTVTI